MLLEITDILDPILLSLYGKLMGLYRIQIYLCTSSTFSNCKTVLFYYQCSNFILDGFGILVKMGFKASTTFSCSVNPLFSHMSMNISFIMFYYYEGNADTSFLYRFY